MKRLVLTFAILIGLAAPSQADYQDGLGHFLRYPHERHGRR